VPDWFPDANTWAAWAQCLTAAIALGAAFFAYQQVKEARDTRERVTQPEVVVFLDHHKIRRYVDFVIKNFGQTTAYNIRITLPPLEVARYVDGSTGDKMHLLRPDKIAVLAPGQEWRTVWDSCVRREEFKGELTDQYGGHVTFDDKVDGHDKRTYTNPIALDIKMFWNTMWIERNESKTVKGALYDIADALKSYGQEHEGIWAYTEPGEAQRTYMQELAEYSKSFHDEIMRQLTRGHDEPHSPNETEEPPL
jgi:hypothetical protein